MTNQPPFGVVVFAKDLARVARFYQELLSLSVGVAEPDLIVLESSGFQLVVHPLPKKVARSIAITTPAESRTNVPTKLFFYVSALAQARQQAALLGGALDPEKNEWEARASGPATGKTPKAMSSSFASVWSNPSIERTSQWPLRALWSIAHVER